MAEIREFRLPDVGEGLTEAEVLTWHVAIGDHVDVNQTLVEIETAKAAVELPSPFAGVVTTLFVEPGVTVPVGTPLIAIATGAEAGEEPPPIATPPVEVKREAVLVGYGVAPSTTTRRVRRGSRPSTESPSPAEAPTESPTVRAKPPVRKRAKELGVDLAAVTPTGADGVITRADVEAAGTAPVRTDSREERIPVRGVLKSMAEAMVRSASTAPHVTEWVDVDVTESEKLCARLREMPEFEGASVGPTLVAAWALCRAVARHPRINASWDEAAGEVVVKHYVNLGIAAATPRGLVVPNIKDAHLLDLAALGRALKQLTTTARDGRSTPAELAGGTISITNVGVFGVDGGTPILPPGEGAILCLGQVAERPWVVDGEVVPRAVCQLTLSFDHRFVDGELGSQVLSDIAGTMINPMGELVRASLA